MATTSIKPAIGTVPLAKSESRRAEYPEVPCAVRSLV